MAVEESWYSISDSVEAGRALRRRCEQARSDNYDRSANAVLYASLFEGCTLTSFNSVGYNLVSNQTFQVLQIPIVRNTLRSCISTLLSKIFCADAPLPKVMSDGGDWDQRNKAEEIDQFLECEMKLPQGEFDSTDDMWNHAGLLAMTSTGSAAVIVRPGYDQVECELDDTLTMGIDRDGRWGQPQTVVRTAWRDPEAMISRFPKFKEDILASVVELTDPLELASIGSRRPPRRLMQVEYYEGWRVKVRGVVGRHMVCLKNGVVLCDDDYDRKEWPGVIFHWERQLAGDWGTPATQTVYRECLRENQLLDDVDDILHNAPGLIVTGPESVQAQLSGSLRIQRITTELPGQIDTKLVPKLDAEALQMAQNHSQGVHDIMGVSVAQSSAQRAIGTRSGEHEELVAKLFSERFAEVQRRLVTAKVEKTARRFLWAAQDMVTEGCKEFTRQFAKKQSPGDPRSSYTYKTIDVADLSIDDSRFVISIAPVSEDKNSPYTRAIKADKYLQLGKISGDQWLQAQRDADVDAATRLSNSQTDWLEEQIKMWLSAPVEEIPERYQSLRKFQDPVAAGRQVVNAMLQAQIQGCPQERLNYFDRFIDECAALAEQEAAMTQESGQGLVTGAGMPAPPPAN
jgi:hypothetical protein